MMIKDGLNGHLINLNGVKTMVKNIIILRISTWGVGIILALISRLVFLNDNDVIWSITRNYNEIVSILSLIPIAEIMIIVEMIRGNKHILLNILAMVTVLICYLIYIVIWVACTGGV